MSYKSAQRLPLTTKDWLFSWGLVDNVDNLDLAPHFSPYLRNARLDWQSIAQRPWHQLFATLTAWSYPKGITSYLRTNTDNDRIIVRHNKDADEKLVSIEEDGTVTDINTGALIASDNRMSFVNIGDLLYCMNWADLFGRLEGTTYTAPNTQGYYKLKAWSGLDDRTPLDIPQVSNTYIIEITGTWSPNQFKRNVNGWAYTTGVNITWGAQVISGMTFQFTATTWHTLWDKWTISTWFAPAFWVVFNGCLWSSWRTLAPNVVFKSRANEYENYFGSGIDTFTFPETVTGLAVTNQALYYFTPNTISVTGYNDVTDTAWSLTFNNRPLQVKEWAVNNASIVTAGTAVYYLTTSNAINKIIQWQNAYWFEVQDLSERAYAGIGKIMSTLDRDQSDSFGYFLPVEMLIKWHLKSMWSTFNDVCIVYDITKDKFLVDNQKNFFGATFFKGKNYTISMIEEKVFQDEYSDDDEGSAIPFEYHTKEFYYGDPTIKKILRESRTLLDMNELAQPTQEIWIDWAATDTKTLDDDNIPNIVWWIGTQTVWEEAIGAGEFDDDMRETYILRTKGNLNKKWRKIQWRFVNSVVWSKVKLKSINAKVEICDPLTTSLTS
jgi:hypothetical protein